MEDQQLEVYVPLTPVQEEIVKVLKLGNTRTAAFTYAGIAKDTFYRWLRENRTFSDAVSRAEATAEVQHVGIIAKAAGEGDWRASLEWLKRRKRDEWGDNLSVGTDKRAEELLAALFPEDAGANPEAIGDREPSQAGADTG